MNKKLIALALIAGVTAVLVVVSATIVLSGIVSIKASSGHWPVTAALLDFVKVRSIATHSMVIPVPPLDDPSMVMKGAAHYEAGCRPCHGSPAIAPPKIPERMTPPPPRLRQRVSRWNPEELFYMVKHGVKFTGMPAWPSAGRDDEVWSVVAFLRVLPRMDAAVYERLVFGGIEPQRAATTFDDPIESPTAPAIVTESCGRCHGRNGQGRETAAFPRLAGQRPAYLRLALQAYAAGSRPSGIMGPIASGLDAGAMQDVADYYASRPPSARPADPLPVDRGARIATRGIPSQQVPRCAECHGPAAHDLNPAYPILAGQHSEYLELQLGLFADGQRGGTPYAHIMQRIARQLTPPQMSDVADYYASLSARDAR